MEKREPKPWAVYLRVGSPLAMAAVGMLYFLGGGIAHYLGKDFHWDFFFLGLMICWMISESQIFLNEYFNILEKGKSILLVDPPPGEEAKRIQLEQNRSLIVSFSFLTIAAVLVVLLISQHALRLSSGLFLVMLELGGLMISCPPLRWSRSGYGQLMETFLILYVVPAFALSLQTGEIHRLLAMNIFPLTCLYLAMLLVQEMPHYGEAIRTGQKNLMTMLGSSRGMTLHNLLIALAYLLLGCALLFGMPWSLVWPALLTLPLALLEIGMMIQIDEGAKPRWRTLAVSSSGLFFLMAYLLTFSIWIR